MAECHLSGWEGLGAVWVWGNVQGTRFGEHSV